MLDEQHTGRKPSLQINVRPKQEIVAPPMVADKIRVISFVLEVEQEED